MALSRFRPAFELDKVTTRCDNFAILVPIFNDIAYLKNVEWLSRYSDRVVLCTTAQESPDFMTSLSSLVDAHGFRIAVTDLGTTFSHDAKNPWTILSKSIFGHDAVLRASIARISEDYVIFLDGDTMVDGDLSLACGAMIEQGLDLASVRVLPSRRLTLIERLQGIEYDVAMDGRRVYPWLTSGAGMIADTAAMSHILQNHSMFFNGGDIEIGKLALSMGKRVGHIPIIFLTEVPSTLSAWVRQRISWMCGAFRHCVINVDNALKYPGHFVYYFLILYVLLPARLYEIVTAWHMLAFVYAVYAVITFIMNWHQRAWWLLLFPIYALFQATFIIWLGAVRYIRYVIRTLNFGRIRITRLRRRKRTVISANRRRIAVGYLLNSALVGSVVLLMKWMAQ